MAAASAVPTVSGMAAAVECAEGNVELDATTLNAKRAIPATSSCSSRLAAAPAAVRVVSVALLRRRRVWRMLRRCCACRCGLALVWEVLLTRRVCGTWHLHGGKVESAETDADAARRETLEEVGVRCGVLTHLGAVAGVSRAISLLVATDWAGAPRAVERGTAVSWVRVDALARMSPALASLYASEAPLLEYINHV